MSQNIKYLNRLVLPAVVDSLYMVFFSLIIATFVGFFFAVILVVTDKDGLHPNRVIYRLFNIIINILRSMPFIILAIAIIPVTRFVVGTSIGRTAAIFPLSIVASALISRLFEGNLKEVNKGMVRAALSFGATNLQIIFKIMLVEALPSMCSSLTVAAIGVLSSSAMAGAIGAGGIGAVAVSYGYQSFNDFIIYVCVLILIVIVQVIQAVGSYAYRRLRR